VTSLFLYSKRLTFGRTTESVPQPELRHHCQQPNCAGLAMASKGAENRAAAVEVWERTRHVARLDPVTPWELLRRQWTRQVVAAGFNLRATHQARSN
jgi:hypothetical protein